LVHSAIRKQRHSVTEKAGREGQEKEKEERVVNAAKRFECRAKRAALHFIGARFITCTPGTVHREDRQRRSEHLDKAKQNVTTKAEHCDQPRCATQKHGNCGHRDHDKNAMNQHDPKTTHVNRVVSQLYARFKCSRVAP
jgi:hypothetical protein